MTNPLDPFTSHILSEIKQEGLYSRPRVDYHEFRTQWLALFNDESHDGRAPLGEWIQAKCRSNPFIEVDVFKGGRVMSDPLYEGQTTVEGGEYMFTIPPILNNGIDIKLKSGKNISNVATQSAEVSKRIAAAGANHFKKNVIDDLVINVENETRLSKEMDKIFEHFGVVRNKKFQVSTNAPIIKEDNPALRTSNDDLDFNF